MQTGITGEPPPFSYRLRVEDVVAYWVYLCRHERRLVPPAVIREMNWPLAVLPVLAGTIVLIAVVAIGDPRASSWRTGVGVGTLLVGFFGTYVLLQLISARPGLFLERRPGLALARWLCLSRLAGLARKQADGGKFDTASAWRFSMTAEGFTLLTEREELCAGVVTVVGKRIQAPWVVLEHVGGTEGHLFLTARDGTVFIVPRGAVQGDAAFRQLVETAERYHRAAVEGSPPATAITIRVEQVQGASRPSEGIMRPEERVVR